MHKLESKTSIRNALRGRRISEVEMSVTDGEVREVTLHLDDHTSVELRATAWQALAVEQA